MIAYIHLEVRRDVCTFIFTKSVQEGTEMKCPVFDIPMPHFLQSGCGLKHTLHNIWCLISEY